ncbi:hypothetical protein ONZ45_g13866 [Pleurotus djamor]|nr:hypothetical protein ONZ45_g13866 [Pleurotus djamor]
MPRLISVSLFWLLISTLSALVSVLAYIPASPTNDTALAVRGGLNITDSSQLALYWQNGYDHMNVSFQLAGRDSLGLSRGALIHFSEEHVNETTPATTAPWIALVACDANATHASMEIDIFTLARDKGAKAALLYSLHSQACVINAEYTNQGIFDQVFDIFATQGNTSSHLIENQFSIQTFKFYDSQQMNDSAVVITESVNSRVARTPEYVFSALIAYNSTDPDRDSPTPDSSVNQTPTTTATSTSTSLAMIILYAITGCVSALFCIVIISGAIRAIRHPERYGPRSGRGFGGSYSQSRVRGLTRAMLDTFPVVKFGSSPGDAVSHTGPTKDVEAEASFDSSGPDEDAASPKIVLKELTKDYANKADNADATDPTKVVVHPSPASKPITPDPSPPSPPPEPSEETAPAPAPSSSTISLATSNRFLQAPSAGPSRRPSTAPAGPNRSKAGPSTSLRRLSQPEVAQASMGLETCPICIVDFEEGDDLRVLPCEGKHRFHQHPHLNMDEAAATLCSVPSNMPSGFPLEQAGIVSIWLEVRVILWPLDWHWILTEVVVVSDQGLLYGVYASLFFEAMYLMVKQRMMIKSGPSRVFFWGCLLMFIVATIHIALNVLRLLRGYVFLSGEVGPAQYFLDLGRWENVAHDALNAFMTWIADGLIIYRAFLVWNNNFYVIILPCLLLIMSIIANAIALKEFTQAPMGTIFGPSLKHWMNSIYALAFVQNVMTTGLIAYRIWRQERESNQVGIHTSGSRSSLMPIVRIVIESAMIYVVELLVLIILYALHHNGQFVVQESVVPTVGIVFTLLTIRIIMRAQVTTNPTSEAQSHGIRWRRPTQNGPLVTTEFTTTISPDDVIDMKPMHNTSPFTEAKYDEHENKRRSLIV